MSLRHPRLSLPSGAGERKEPGNDKLRWFRAEHAEHREALARRDRDVGRKTIDEFCLRVSRGSELVEMFGSFI
jgi:hypothetical protein